MHSKGLQASLSRFDGFEAVQKAFLLKSREVEGPFWIFAGNGSRCGSAWLAGLAKVSGPLLFI